MTFCHFSYIKIHDLTRGFEQQCLFGRTEKKNGCNWKTCKANLVAYWYFMDESSKTISDLGKK